MPKTIDIDSIIKSNPKVDRNRFEEAISTIRRLEKQGVRASKYNIASPFSRRHSSKNEETEDDPRTVYLRK